MPMKKRRVVVVLASREVIPYTFEVFQRAWSYFVMSTFASVKHTKIAYFFSNFASNWRAVCWAWRNGG